MLVGLFGERDAWGEKEEERRKARGCEFGIGGEARVK